MDKSDEALAQEAGHHVGLLHLLTLLFARQFAASAEPDGIRQDLAEMLAAAAKELHGDAYTPAMNRALKTEFERTTSEILDHAMELARIVRRSGAGAGGDAARDSD